MLSKSQVFSALSRYIISVINTPYHSKSVPFILFQANDTYNKNYLYQTIDYVNIFLCNKAHINILEEHITLN